MKKITITFVSLFMLGTVIAPTTIALADSNTNIETTELSSSEFSDKGYQLYLQRNEGQIKLFGVKQKAVVYALKYGGKYLSEIVSILSKTNANYLKKHSYAIATKLEKLNKQGEGILASYIMTLGVPSTAARTIAWAIMFVAF